MNTCHICLEDIENASQEIIKDCCDAFICNSCWIKLKDNPETIQCPICKRSMHTQEIYHQPQRSFYDNYRTCILNICRLLSWITIGYVVIVLILYMAYYDNIDLFWKDMKYLSIRLHFWIGIGCFGFIIFHSIKSCIGCLCNIE